MISEYEQCDVEECEDGFVFIKELHGGIVITVMQPCPKCKGGYGDEET